MSYPLTARHSRLLGAGVAFQAPTIMMPSLRGQVPPRLTSPIPPKPISAIRPAPGTVQFPTGISEPIPPPPAPHFLAPGQQVTTTGKVVTPATPGGGRTDQGGGPVMSPGPGGVPILTGPISGPDSSSGGGGGGGGGGGVVSAGPDGVAVAGQAEIPWTPILIAAALGALYLASRGS